MEPSYGKSGDSESRAQGTTSTEEVALRKRSPGRKQGEGPGKVQCQQRRVFKEKRAVGDVECYCKVSMTIAKT